MPPFTVRKSPAATQCFTEPLEGLGDAIALDMVLVKGGTFTMGSPKDEEGYEDYDGPQHEVTVPTFFMARYPVTQAQWRVVAAMPQVSREIAVDPANFKGPNRPVERVSWYDTVEFCQRLAKASGRPYRLPSEAEWEYSCRAGTRTPFSFGRTLTTEIANYYGNSTYNKGPAGKDRRETTPVNYFGVANIWGLCDMHGNVHEWCQDHWHDNYEGAHNDESAWLTDNEEANRVMRGGSWLDDPWFCRSAFRTFIPPDDCSDYVGFRVVCNAPKFIE